MMLPKDKIKKEKADLQRAQGEQKALPEKIGEFHKLSRD